MFKIRLCVGDWSNDGHGIAKDVIISSSLDKNQIEDAYENGTGILGFDFSNTVCVEYEDMELPYREFCILKGNGLYDFLRLFNSEETCSLLLEQLLTQEPCADEDLPWTMMPNSYTVNIEDYYSIFWLFVAWLGNKNLSFKFQERVDTINIGGYGLFQS